MFEQIRLFTEEEFKNAKSRDLLPLQCNVCKTTFMRPKNWIQANDGKFCSLKCDAKRRQNKQLVTCELETCGKTFLKLPKEIKKSKHNFCCQSHATTYHNAHKTKGSRVSKLERWLQLKLPEKYPDLEFHFNRSDTISGELDIFIPTLRLAFELNGIFHYEPIFGEDKLKNTQSTDCRKFKACIEHNISLCVIDVTSMKNFKEQKALAFFEIIRNIIEQNKASKVPYGPS